MSGWNLPPGVTDRMIDEAFGGEDPSELQENVLALLEKARFSQATCDAIMEMIREEEAAKAEPDPDEARERRMDSADWWDDR